MGGQVLPCQFMKIEKECPEFGKKAMVVFIYAWNFPDQETQEKLPKRFSPGKMENVNFWDYKIFVSFKHQWLENHRCTVYQTVYH